MGGGREVRKRSLPLLRPNKHVQVKEVDVDVKEKGKEKEGGCVCVFVCLFFTLLGL